MRIEKWGSGVGNKPFWKVFHGPTNFFDATRHVPRLSIQFEWDWRVGQRSFVSLARASIRFEWNWKQGQSIDEFSTMALALEKWAKNRWPCFQRGWIKGFRRGGQNVHLRGGQKVDKVSTSFSAVLGGTSYKISRKRVFETAPEVLKFSPKSPHRDKYGKN